jgi:hypothetical protein
MTPFTDYSQLTSPQHMSYAFTVNVLCHGWGGDLRGMKLVSRILVI